jgi:hypothetical protein
MSVRLQLENPALLENLLGFLRKRGCAGERVTEDTIEVELPHELHLEQARVELDLYLRVWQSLHGWTRVDVVD